MSSKLDQYTLEELQEIVKNSNSMSEVCRQLGYSKSGDAFKLIRTYLEKFNIDTSHFQTTSRIKRTKENVFMKDSTADQKTLRKWYIEGDYTPYKCAICGLSPYWNGQPLTLILDHINGENHDNRLENLRWVCPNCNQQLPTTNGKNLVYNK